jgi:hypothetical protein
MASPIVRDTIKKLRARKALLEKQVKGPLLELRQIEEDLAALGATARPAAGAKRRGAGAGNARAPRGANEAAILRAIRNGATTPPEIAEKTGLAASAVTRSLTAYDQRKLVVTGPNGLTLTKAGRDRLRALEAA